MDNNDLLYIRSRIKKPFDICVGGTSMQPVLHDGEAITVCRKDEYSVGDILVFRYKEHELIVHRLLKISNGRYFCKGDNSFRLEDIDIEQIIGAVVMKSDKNNSSEFVIASLNINRIFRKSGYSIELTKESLAYIEYKHKYLENKDEI